MKEVFTEAFGIFLEGLTPAILISSFMMALVGQAFRMLVTANKRDPGSPRTPYEFSWTFLISDNSIRIYKGIALSIITIFVSLRFANYFIGKTLGGPFTMLYAFLLGLCLDFVVDRWRFIIENTKRIFSSKPANDDI